LEQGTGGSGADTTASDGWVKAGEVYTEMEILNTSEHIVEDRAVVGLGHN
jgi:hypothetical protein